MQITSSYAKILGETNFHTREFPQSGSKAKDGEKKREEERLNDGDNNSQATHGARKPPGPKEKESEMIYLLSLVGLSGRMISRTSNSYIFYKFYATENTRI